MCFCDIMYISNITDVLFFKFEKGGRNMKLEVNVVTTHLGKSPVIVDGNVVSVSGLPEGLCTKMMCLLKMLEYSRVTTISFVVTDNNESILLVRKDGENCLPDVIADLGIRSYLKETIELLAWYFKKHFWSMHGDRLGGSWYCSDCHRLQRSKGDNKCYNWQCSSHQKMLDIDPTYVPVTEEEDPAVHRAREWGDMAADMKPYVRQH